MRSDCDRNHPHHTHTQGVGQYGELPLCVCGRRAESTALSTLDAQLQSVGVSGIRGRDRGWP